MKTKKPQICQVFLTHARREIPCSYNLTTKPVFRKPLEGSFYLTVAREFLTSTSSGLLVFYIP